MPLRADNAVLSIAFFTALIAGSFAGIAAAAFHIATTVPLIHQAEVFEHGEDAADQHRVRVKLDSRNEPIRSIGRDDLLVEGNVGPRMGNQLRALDCSINRAGLTLVLFGLARCAQGQNPG
jgi:hypothetical protein